MASDDPNTVLALPGAARSLTYGWHYARLAPVPTDRSKEGMPVEIRTTRRRHLPNVLRWPLR